MNRISLSLAAVFIAVPFIAAADELDTTYQSLQSAEAKKDAAQVKKLAVDAIKLARQVEAAPVPESVDPEAWKQHQQKAKEIAVNSEYALLATALTADPATAVDLFATLEAQNPKSKYLDEGYTNYFADLEKTGGAAKIPAIAERGLANFPNNEDLLFVMVDEALTKNQTDKALSCATRLIAAANKSTKPEGVPAADWERKRNAELGRGYWAAGVIYGQRNRYIDADKNLRAALPLIKGNDGMMGPALFYLGVADYNLGKMTMDRIKIRQAADFSQQCAAIKGPYAEQAWKNAGVMRTEADRMR